MNVSHDRDCDDVVSIISVSVDTEALSSSIDISEFCGKFHTLRYRRHSSNVRNFCLPQFPDSSPMNLSHQSVTCWLSTYWRTSLWCFVFSQIFSFAIDNFPIYLPLLASDIEFLRLISKTNQNIAKTNRLRTENKIKTFNTPQWCNEFVFYGTRNSKIEHSNFSLFLSRRVLFF